MAKSTKTAKTAKTTKISKAGKKQKAPTWAELNKSYSMLDVLSGFLADGVVFQKAPKYSKDLIKKITVEWATSLLPDKKQKHKAAIIKSFGELVASA
jgi:hypothetical protein